MNYAPLALFAFNRVETLSKMLDGLSKCENLTGNGQRGCYAFLDGPRNANDVPKIDAVRALLESFKKEVFPNMFIVARERNLGNPVNMPSGISQVLDEHGRAIIIEDDVLVSRTFLTYMDSALDYYEGEKKIWCINAWRSPYVRVPQNYNGDVYLNPRNLCWGWGTWKDRWDAVDMSMADWEEFKKSPTNIERLSCLGIDLPPMLERQAKGALKSWDVQCSYHMAKNDLYAIEPIKAMTKNIGCGTECAHCKQENPAITRAKFYNFTPRLLDYSTLKEKGADANISFRYMALDFRFLSRVRRKIYRTWLKFGPMNDEPIDYTR